MISKLYGWYGKTTVRLVAGVLCLLVVVALTTLLSTETPVETTSESLPLVTVANVATLGGQQSFSLLGTIASVSEATVQTEAAGRVTAVNVSLGDTVAPGTVLIQLENSAQRAAVLQAEGAYEAALAGAAQSDVGLDDARTGLRSATNNALDANRNAYTTTNSVVISVLDDVFADPTSMLPGVRIDAGNSTQFLNQTRIELQQTLPTWQQLVNNATAESSLSSITNTSIENVQTVLGMVDALLTATIDQDNKNRTVAGASIETYRSRLTTARSQLLTALDGLNVAETTLQTANDAVRRAEISASNASTLSTANAQIKQAEGSLLAAQSALAKTIVRAPIRGVVNKIDVNVGDFLPSFAEVAQIVNDSALEVTVFVGESDRARLQEGQTVQLNNLQTGVVTAIAPAIDPATRKFEVKIGTDAQNLSSGSTVTVTLESATTTTNTTIAVPITAVKFTDRDGSVFTVVDGVLQSVSVTIGTITGETVEILSGLSATDEIVVDARGLVAGQRVEAVNN